ncbi:MAG: N,N-dimethylformamidase large subunit, partial [Alphaproteobacteria bacterium]|nr:N,N-dimethylformamidase large subunit [Alphaproteobacteria bacterium]
PYKRVNYDKNMDWVFDGINGELLGDFGFSGHGAAGFELDRRDEKLDEGEDIIILAQSYDEDNRFILVPEEMLTHLTNLSGSSEADAKRADMVYFKTANGGQVFAVGSITFCGSLPWNNYDNNISTLLRNVVRKFVES